MVHEFPRSRTSPPVSAVASVSMRVFPRHATCACCRSQYVLPATRGRRGRGDMTHFRRIEAFLSSLGGESIDTKFPRIEGKRADYLLFDRTVIVEIKNLEDSRVEAVEKVLWKWLVRPGDPIPIFYGNWDRVRSGSALIAAQLLAIGG